MRRFRASRRRRPLPLLAFGLLLVSAVLTARPIGSTTGQLASRYSDNLNRAASQRLRHEFRQAAPALALPVARIPASAKPAVKGSHDMKLLPAPPSDSVTDLRDPLRKARAAQIISSFENSTLTLQYGYAENLHDGRGITAGRAGFCSGTHDMLLVVVRYAALRPGNVLEPYLPALRAVDGTASTAGLGGLEAAWGQAAADPRFRQAQDEIVDKLYFNPAMGYAKAYGIITALGQAILWDTIIQHGDGDDPDGIAAMLAETKRQRGGAATAATESAWLQAFLTVRRQHLLAAADPDTRAAWAESVDRVTALQSLLTAGKLRLDPVLTWTVYGDKFSIKD